MIFSPAFTILPEIPRISLIDFGLFSENTKLVWHSGIHSKIFLILVNSLIAFPSFIFLVSDSSKFVIS